MRLLSKNFFFFKIFKKFNLNRISGPLNLGAYFNKMETQIELGTIILGKFSQKYCAGFVAEFCESKSFDHF